jgi:bifunctional UDP-N-acetylglucosamine pyrophosphorylase/glucosamine-1-phosphate N-acetyltransferase
MSVQSNIRNLHIVVLAAGKGKRLHSDRPKVLHELGGEPLLAHVLRSARALRPNGVHVVIGHGAEMVREAFPDKDLRFVVQEKQRGTAHAVSQALPRIPANSVVLVMYGDVPLIRAETLRPLVRAAARGALGLLTAELADGTGYGRILRGARGRVVGVVEQKDASAEQKTLREINTGFVAAPAARVRRWLSKIGNRNAQREYYLTDMVALAAASGVPIEDVRAGEPGEILGVNSRSELAQLERSYRRRRARQLLEQGVTLLDPERLDVRGEVKLGRDCVLDVNVILVGPTAIGQRVRIGAGCVIKGSAINDDVVIHPYSVVDGAQVGAGSLVGPFAHLRPGARIATGAHIGNFVEIKNSEVGAGAKINHLSYVGDSDVGRRVNIGAGTITCNYDGAYKHRTVIGDDAFVGSNTPLVAPVTVGKGATVGAGSVITRDTPPGALALTRPEQRTISGWKRPAKK